MSKGSNRRPSAVSQRTLDERWARTFAPPRSDALAVLREIAGTVSAPPDWAAEHDHYLYGTPKRTAPAEASAAYERPSD